MISIDLKEYILKEIQNSLVEEKTKKRVSQGRSKKCCASAAACIDEETTHSDFGICAQSVNRIIDEESDFECLSSVANGPCKTFDEIFNECVNDLNHIKEMTFSEYLLYLIDERKLKDSYVYKNASISKQLFSKIRSDKFYIPKKKTVYALAFALHLDLDKTIDLLNKAGYNMSKNPMDISLQILIENRIYDVLEVNKFLYELQQKGYNVELLGY